jgi:hypothetical protein
VENRKNVIAIGRGPTDVGRRFWSFSYPHQVVNDRNIGLDAKRAILTAWASDNHAVESLPTLRHLPGTPIPVTVSSIVDALSYLDRTESAAPVDRSPAVDATPVKKAPKAKVPDDFDWAA